MIIDKNKYCISRKLLISMVLIFTVIVILLYFISTLNQQINSRSLVINNKAMEKKNYLSDKKYYKKILMIVYDPIVDGNNKFSQYLQNKKRVFYDPLELKDKIIETFKSVSGGRIDYQVAEVIEDKDFPKKLKSQINLEKWNKCNSCPKNSPGFKNICLGKIDYEYELKKHDVCSKVNSHQIDEVWLWGGSYFGFYESLLVGPNKFNFNDGNISISDLDCKRLIPVMGFSYERNLGDALHDFGHRLEYTMEQVYGGTNLNKTETRWDQFAKTRTKNNSIVNGCGSVHYPPIYHVGDDGSKEYQYDTRKDEDKTICNKFSNYKIFNSESIYSDEKPISISCQIDPWKCTQEGYLTWWFSHLPQFEGVGFDGALNDWIAYFIEPSFANIYKGKKTNINVAEPVEISPASNLIPQCQDHTSAGSSAGPKECENKQSNGQNCKWYEYCSVCSKSSNSLGESCFSFCSQFDSDKGGCISAQNNGYGCVWYNKASRCVNKVVSLDELSKLDSPKTETRNKDFEIRVKLTDKSDIYINKILKVNVYEQGRDNMKLLISKLLTDKSYPNISYKVRFDNTDYSLKLGKKYFIEPQLITNIYNPVNYSTKSEGCVFREDVGLFECEIGKKSLLEFDVVIEKISCFNIPEIRFCNIYKCLWSNEYGFCYDRRSDKSNFDKYCASINNMHTCIKNSFCTWEITNKGLKKSSCVFNKFNQTPVTTENIQNNFPMKKTSTTIPTPEPMDNQCLFE